MTCCDLNGVPRDAPNIYACQLLSPCTCLSAILTAFVAPIYGLFHDVPLFIKYLLCEGVYCPCCFGSNAPCCHMTVKKELDHNNPVEPVTSAKEKTFNPVEKERNLPVHYTQYYGPERSCRFAHTCICYDDMQFGATEESLLVEEKWQR